MLEGRGIATVMRAGARAPIGLSRLQVAMGIRAGRLDPRPCSFRDKNGATIGTCRVGGLPENLVGHDRLLALAVPALREAWPAEVTQRLPMVLAMPAADRPDDDPRFGPAFIDALGAKSHCPIDLQNSRVVRGGHAGFVLALEEAANILTRPGRALGSPAVIVGGVDSYHHEGVLQWLDSNHRLHAMGTENGILPSEGAAFAILVRPGGQLRDERGLPMTDRPLGQISALRWGREESFLMNRPNLAEALTTIVQDLVGQNKGLSWVLTDVNGERHRSKEWALVSLRAVLEPDAIQLAAPRFLGDVGAATGPLLLATACTLFATGAAPARRAGIILQSDGPERGAFVVEEVT